MMGIVFDKDGSIMELERQNEQLVASLLRVEGKLSAVEGDKGVLMDEIREKDARIAELEQDKFLLRQILHDIAFFRHVVRNDWNAEYEKGYNQAVSDITKDAVEFYTNEGIGADEFDSLHDLQKRITKMEKVVEAAREFAGSRVDIVKLFRLRDVLAELEGE